MSSERWIAPRPGWYRVMGVGEPVFAGEEPPVADRPEHLVRFDATAADPVPCRNCHSAYDPTDPAAVTQHTEPVDCGQSCRCRDRPACYTCFGSFCFCMAH
ncbi:hypothetical protein [Actinacidiphila acididurans]|uniref:Uncharacterized protein n=1 Tax=Actinacidiphila acididurans TaxID=2784346 RepID=A0ABS2TYT2_9ACTN|nr:hypothetical protein [Actinacidiphila acididurans]MBM9507982.1 hypothetical protein [Actinacidiphila acididurans]